MSKATCLALAVLSLLTLSALASAQATTTCQSSYSGGSGLFDFTFCVTENGNIAQLAAPHSYEHIATSAGLTGEGYGICDVASGTEYADYAGYGATSNWLNPVITQPGGPNTLPLTIFRTTSDGLWQLKQEFSRDILTRAVKVAMTLINQAAVKKDAYLIRYADIDANGQADNLFQATMFSAFASNFGVAGMQLRDTGKFFPLNFVQDVPEGPKPCDIFRHAATSGFFGNGSLGLFYPLTVPKNGKKTVNIAYRPI